MAAQLAHPEPVAARLPPVKALVAREEITPLVQQIKDLQVPRPVVPATTISNKPKSRELAHIICKQPLDITKMEVMDFPASIPNHTEPAQMLFMLLISISGPPAQYPVVIVAKDPHTPVQYDGLVATQQKEAAASKGKGKAIPSDNESNYGEEESEQEHDSEEGKMPHEKLQQIAWNKCIAKKKANITTAHAAQVKKAVNNFSGQIPNGLGVKIWWPLDVEQLNLCFQGALGNCTYYLAMSNVVLVGVDPNHAAAFEFTLGKHMALPGSIIYKHAPHGLPCTLHELKKLFNYYKNEYVLCHNHIVAFMLLGKLQLFAQRTNELLLNHTMKLMLTEPQYQNMVNLM
ncbi:hypothetical protein C0993_006104 [Termitomyces sp. T159_Od127]|nr:hypothetical protein C0993_006104 [Termitomyces sp. T159_Od127]